MIRRTPIKKQSVKGLARQKLLSKIKQEKLEEQVSLHGYAYCEWPGCFKLYPQEEAKYGLDLDHIRKRSLCGGDDPKNLRLICVVHNRFERP